MNPTPDALSQAKKQFGSSRICRHLAFLGFALCLTGCAAMSNPVADGIPVNRVPPELLGRSREELEDVPLRLLRRKRTDVYRLAPGDILAIWIPNLLGEEDRLPPLLPSTPGEDLPPAIGSPVPVGENGTILLPQVPPIFVQGMTQQDVQNTIKRAYTIERHIFPEDQFNPIVTLYRKRRYNVLVIRQDSGSSVAVSNNTIFGTSAVTSSSKRGSGQVVSLAEGENDLLTALAKTGGLPGTDAVNEVLVEKHQRLPGTSEPDLRSRMDELSACKDLKAAGLMGQAERFTRVPLRVRPGDRLPFTAEDIELHDGDIVFIGSRDTEVFYTGGLLGTAQFPLPRDIDIDVIQAIALAHGPLVNGAFSGNNLSGGVVQGGIGFPNPSRLTVIRKTADKSEIRIKVDVNEAFRDKKQRILVQAGDFLILQETPGEAFVNYLNNTLRLGFTLKVLNTPTITSNLNGTFP